MDSANKRFKIIHIIFTIVDFLVLINFAYRMFTINYAYVYQNDRETGIENLPLSFSVLKGSFRPP